MSYLLLHHGMQIGQPLPSQQSTPFTYRLTGDHQSHHQSHADFNLPKKYISLSHL